MKARLLKKLMNDSGYYPNDNREYIAMGSPLCHDLISVNKKTLEVKYALDTFRKGRESLGNDKLVFIWDKFHELIKNGEIHDIINGVDEIENPLPVWTFDDDGLIETYTDEYGWPNTTYDGKVMYENLHFKTREEAIDKGIREYKASIQYANRRKEDILKNLEEVEEWIQKSQKNLDNFLELKSNI